MSHDFFKQPILNSPYEYPSRHWELDETGQPTQTIVDRRRSAEFITPIPKPKKRKKKKGKRSSDQAELVFDEGKGLSTEAQQYDHTAIINGVRQEVDRWRMLPQEHWKVTPETARLLEHWRHHQNVAPYMNRERYLAGMQWKKGLHAEKGTKLLNSYYYERKQGTLLKNLEKQLASEGVEVSTSTDEGVLNALNAEGRATELS